MNLKSQKAKQLIKQHPRIEGIYYVVVNELPEDQQKPFSDWLIGQTLPVIEEEERKYGKVTITAYSWDYEYWYDYWIKGEEALVTD